MMPPTTPSTGNLAPDQRWSTSSHASLRLKATFRQAKAPVHDVHQSHGPRWTLLQPRPEDQEPSLTTGQATTNLPAAASNPHSPILKRR